MTILLAPHPDDETLFAAYTIIREKPLVIVVTHPTMQGDNGYERIMESYRAMRILGASVCFLHIPEHDLDGDVLTEKLQPFIGASLVYAPDLESGNPHHDMVHLVAKELFSNVKTYRTYGKNQKRTLEGDEVIPTANEVILKKQAMECYTTQLNNQMTHHYFMDTREFR